MSKVLIEEQTLYDIGDAIREINGLDTTYKPGEMVSAINLMSEYNYVSVLYGDTEPSSELGSIGDIYMRLDPFTHNAQGYSFPDNSVYTPIDYIECTGAQSLNTGVVGGTQDLEIELCYMSSDVQGTLSESPILGNAWSERSMFLMIHNNHYRMHDGGSTASAVSVSTVSTTSYQTIRLKHGVGMNIDDEQYAYTSTGGITNSQQPIRLFSNIYGTPTNTTKYPASGKLKYIIIASGSTILRYMVPVLNETSIPGLLDLVSNVFYGSDTESPFVGGSPINEGDIGVSHAQIYMSMYRRDGSGWNKCHIMPVGMD